MFWKLAQKVKCLMESSAAATQKQLGYNSGFGCMVAMAYLDFGRATDNFNRGWSQMPLEYM